MIRLYRRSPIADDDVSPAVVAIVRVDNVTGIPDAPQSRVAVLMIDDAGQWAEPGEYPWEPIQADAVIRWAWESELVASVLTGIGAVQCK